jgi:hypothetical protein
MRVSMLYPSRSQLAYLYSTGSAICNRGHYRTLKKMTPFVPSGYLARGLNSTIGTPASVFVVRKLIEHLARERWPSRKLVMETAGNAFVTAKNSDNQSPGSRSNRNAWICLINIRAPLNSPNSRDTSGP